MKKRESKYESKTISIRRVSKVTSGGKRLRFSAMVVAGDKNGSLGVALGRGMDTKSAIEKAIRKAEKSVKKIQLIGDTIPHEVRHKKGAAEVLLRPAKPGTGVIAGSSVRTVLEICGVDNVYGKILGSNNIIMNTYCTYEALLSLKSSRVLDKMHKMKDRLHLKEQLDMERKKRESLLKQKSASNFKKDKKGSKRGSFKPKRQSNKEVETLPKNVEDTKKVEVAKSEVKSE